MSRFDYKPTDQVLPNEPADATVFLHNRLRALENQFVGLYSSIHKPLSAEPAKPRQGQIAFADGTNWDPGADAGLFLGAGLYQYTGTVWQRLNNTDLGGPSGNGNPIELTPTQPENLPDWANQGSSFVTVIDSRSWLLSGHANNANNLRVRSITAPATPYTAVVFVDSYLPYLNYPSLGMVWSDGTKYHYFNYNLGYQNNPQVAMDYWTTASNYSADRTQATFNAVRGGMLGLALVDDGSMKAAMVSWDGVYWHVLYKAARTTDFTPTIVGIAVNGSTTTTNPVIVVRSWKLWDSAFNF